MDTMKLETAGELLACRICLATDTDLFNIMDHHLGEAYVEIIGTMLSAWDGFPQHVCAICRRLLRKSAEFRARGLRAQEKLRHCLMHQHFITTEYIRSVDRAGLRLVLLSAAAGAEPIRAAHGGVKPEPAPEPAPEPEPDTQCKDELLSVGAENMAEDGDSDHFSLKYEDDSNDDVALSELRAEQAARGAKAEERGGEGGKPAGPAEPPPRERKKKVLRKTKVKKVKKVKTETRERRKNMRIRDEDFPAFEKEYNFDVVILTREQQAEDMAARRERDNYRNSTFKCERCFRGFYSEETLRNHNVKHHDESIGPHECSLCRCRFRIPGILRRHLETHRLRFLCQHCGFTARDRSHAMTHSKEHRGHRYECQYCGSTFKKRSTFGTHVRIQHPNENKACDVCGEAFLGALGLALHKKKSHRLDCQQPAESGSACCKQCGVQFASQYALSRHVALAADGCQNTCACALCGANFKDDKGLQEHMREVHRSRETQCQECDMTFATEASRAVHYERVHLKVKITRRLPKSGRKYDRYGDNFMCDMCGKKCQNNIALKYHIRSHTGEKPHACPHCPKHYSTPVGLQYHIRSHTGDKPLVCPHCPLRYATHKGLQTHLLKHTGERPFKCDLCGKAFTQKTMLNKHKTVHTGEKPFSCEICGKTFTQSGSVHTHVKYVHKKLPAPPRNRGARLKPE